MIAEELKNKLGAAAETRHLLSLATLRTSLAYYLDAIKSNSGALESLANSAERAGLTPGDRELLEEIAAENGQCLRQAETCAGLLASTAFAAKVQSPVAPGARTLMLAPNAYPDQGKYTDRIDGSSQIFPPRLFRSIPLLLLSGPWATR